VVFFAATDPHLGAPLDTIQITPGPVVGRPGRPLFSGRRIPYVRGAPTASPRSLSGSSSTATPCLRIRAEACDRPRATSNQLRSDRREHLRPHPGSTGRAREIFHKLQAGLAITEADLLLHQTGQLSAQLRPDSSRGVLAVDPLALRAAKWSPRWVTAIGVEEEPIAAGPITTTIRVSADRLVRSLARRPDPQRRG
jgi:hypothetical protein